MAAAFLLAVALFVLHRKGVFSLIVEIVLYVTRVLFKDILFSFLAYIRGLGTWGSLILCVVYAVCTVLFIPVTVLNLAAGFCFGVFMGFASVSVGGIMGASIAFLAGRHCLRGWVRRTIDGDRTNFNMVDTMLRRGESNTFRIICLSRLPPCLPFPCVNYSYALTEVPFWTYFWATWLGLMPGTFAYVYMGSALRNLSEVFMGGGGGGSWMSSALLLLSVVSTILITLFVVKEAQRVLENGSAQDADGGRSRSSSMGRSAGTTPPHDSFSPRQRKNSSPYTINIDDADDGSEGEDGVAERALEREGEWLLFTDTKETKPSRSRQRTLTRNSSIWKLFNSETASNGASRQRKADRRLEYFL